MNVCLFSCLSYLACKLLFFVPTPIVLCGLSSCYYIFPHFISGTVFVKKLLDVKCMFLFSLHLLDTFSILRRTEQGMIKNVYWCSCTVPLSSLNILGGFSKISNIEFHENQCSGSRVVRSGRTGKMLLIVIFHNFVNVLNKVHMVLLVRSRLSCCSHHVLCKLYESRSDGAFVPLGHTTRLQLTTSSATEYVC
jgi:hypothetical protein